jgi:hypothetical protein
MDDLLPPHQMARKVAQQLWGGIVKQRKLLPGAFYFEGLIRSGVVVLVEQADWLDSLALNVAREQELTDELGIILHCPEWPQSRKPNHYLMRSQHQHTWKWEVTKPILSENIGFGFEIWADSPAQPHSPLVYSSRPLRLALQAQGVFDAPNDIDFSAEQIKIPVHRIFAERFAELHAARVQEALAKPSPRERTGALAV